MMLRHLGYTEPALRIDRAVEEVLQKGDILTPDLGGRSTTEELSNAIIKRI